MVKKTAKKKVPAKKSPVKKADPKRQTGSSDKSIDKLVQAKTPGKRIAKGSKSVYYERRANRSDKGTLLGIGAVKKDLASKYKTAVDNVVMLTGQLASFKVRIKNVPVADRARWRDLIKKTTLQLKEAKALKTKLSKFK